MADLTDNRNQTDALRRTMIDRSLRHPVMFFFTSGAAWLVVSIVLGIVTSIRFCSPEWLDGYAWLATGRVYVAHLNVLIYGWACQAAFGVMIWLMARLSRKECQASGIILLAGHGWNVLVALGLIGILSGNGTGVPWMEFPTFVWPMFFLCYLAIAVWSFIQFHVREQSRVSISQWYLLAAIIWFPWVLFTAYLFVFVFDSHPLIATGVAAWYKAGLLFLFFAPVAIASAYYLVPKVIGRSVYSYRLAIVGFWGLAFVGPWAGMQKLTGAPIPPFLTACGAAATILFLIPALAVGWNVLKTLRGEAKTWTSSPSLRFVVTGVVGLLLFGLAGFIMNLQSVLQVMQFSIGEYGYEILGLYGFFSLCIFGMIYFIVPRVTGREWLSSRFIKWHFWLSLFGVIVVVVFSFVGGFLQGQEQETFSKPWMDATTRAYAYSVGTTIAWIFILISTKIFFIHLVLMWLRLGRRSKHPTLLSVRHAGSSCGAEGDVEELETAGIKT